MEVIIGFNHTERDEYGLNDNPLLVVQARVIGFEKGKGRNASVVGALVCVMACGKQFKVGSG